MKKILLFISLFISLTTIAQIQIGSDINGMAANDYSGWSVSSNSDGKITIIGAIWNDSNGDNSGQTRIFKNENGAWTQVGSDIYGDASGDNFGTSVSINSNGNVIAIGAPKNDINGNDSGQVKIFKNENGSWTQIGSDIYGDASGDNFGISLSLNSIGDIIVVGARYGNIANRGYSNICIYENGAWVKVGNNIDGTEIDEQSGTTVSINSIGNIIAISSPFKDSNGINSGQVRLFKNTNNIWTQIGNDINGDEATITPEFGHSLDLNSNGDIIAIGAPNKGTATNVSNLFGQAKVFKNINNVWTQIGGDIIGSTNSRLGDSVSLNSDGNILAVGAPGNSDIQFSSGQVKIFKNINENWIQIGNNINGDSANDELGNSVSLSSSANSVAIGIYRDNTNSFFYTGNTRVYDLSTILSSNTYVLSKFNIYPNPTKNSFAIDIEDNLEVEKVSIYNNLGQFIKSTKELTINTTNLNTGIYFVEVETNQGKGTKKLVIE